MMNLLTVLFQDNISGCCNILRNENQKYMEQRVINGVIIFKNTILNENKSKNNKIINSNIYILSKDRNSARSSKAFVIYIYIYLPCAFHIDVINSHVGDRSGKYTVMLNVFTNKIADLPF